MIAIIKPTKIAIYLNPDGKTMEAIKDETGCDYIINGGFFEALGKPCPILKVNGVMKAKSDWGAWGMSWNEASDCNMSNTTDKANFISCVDLVNPWEGNNYKLTYNSDVSGARPRTAWGILNNGEHLLYCDTTARTPENLRSYLVENYSIRSLLMLDGGGSVQGNFDGKGYVVSSRRVANFVCFWTTTDLSTTEKAMQTTERYGIKFSKEKAEQIAKILGGEIYKI